jgi:broad specificity phosphatase PhoE
MGLDQRSEWLGGVMRANWADLEPGLRAWRAQLLAAVVEIGAMAPVVVVVTHFVAINVAVGAASDDPRVTCFRPDNCSATVFEVEAGRLRLVQRGGEGVTQVR